MKRIQNEMKLRLPAISVNEGTCRAIISAFCAELNPTIEELGDIRCAVSEAVTNCIVHGYRDAADKLNAYIYLSVLLFRLIHYDPPPLTNQACWHTQLHLSIGGHFYVLA